MKNRTLILAIAVIAVAAITGCNLANLTIPETITIKGAPALEVPGGVREVDVLGLIGFQDILSGIEDPETGISLADTAPGEPLALNLRKELIDISLDDFAGETLDPTAVSQTINVSFDIPSIDLTTPSITSNIAPIALPGSISIPPQSFPGVEPPAPQALPAISATVPASGFTSVTFDGGTLEAVLSLANASGGLTVDVTSADILPAGGGTPIAAAASITGTATSITDITITFNLAGITLPDSFDIELIANADGGDTSAFDMNLNFAFSAATISAAEGVDFTESVGGSTTIPSASADFQTATIGSGSLDLTTTLLPGFTGIGTDVSITLNQGGSPIAGVTWPYDMSGGPLDLSGLTISNQDIVVDYTVDITGTNATFALDAGADEVTVDVTADIIDFSSLDVPASLIDTSGIAIDPIAIPQEVQDFVDTATFVNPVLQVRLDNQLPAGVDIDLNLAVVPAGFALAPQGSSSFPPGAETTNFWELTSRTVTMDFAQITVTPSVTVAGGADPVTLSNVAPGQTYTLSGSVDATLEIDELVIANFTQPLDTLPDVPIDLSGIGGILPPEITLTDITANLELSPNDFVGTLSLFLNARYDQDGDAIIDEMVLIGSGTSASPTMADFTDLSVDIPLSEADLTPGVGMDVVINAAPENLVFDYQVGVSGATIINDPAEETRFGAVLDGRINFAMNASSDAELTDPDTGDPIIPAGTEDIFGRTAAEPDGGIADFLGFASRVALNYEMDNNLGIQIKAAIVDDAIGTTPGEFRKEIDLISGSNVIELTAEDIQRIVDDYDFRPAVHLFIAEGNHQILTDGTVTISASILVESDVEYVFDLSGSEE